MRKTLGYIKKKKSYKNRSYTSIVINLANIG